MPAQVTTRAQVNGYRFLIRRLEHALIRGDSRMIHDPMRGQMRALIVGAIIAVLITGACAVLAFFKPAPSLGDAQILLSKSSGAAFVRIGDRVHPVLNLASARLIVGASENPKEVDDKFLNAVPRGAMVGIVGAPSSIRGADNIGMSSWTVCDTWLTPGVTETTGTPSLQTTVLANDPVLQGIRYTEPAEAILTTAGDTTYLIYDGVRAPVDLADPVVVRGLHLQGAAVRPVSLSLLNTFPLVDPITPVMIDGVGELNPALGPEHPVGSMVSTSDSRGEQLYVVLRDGLQPISPATADIIRHGEADATRTSAREIGPAMLADVPIVHHLPVSHYPSSSPKIIPADPDRVMCMGWQREPTGAQADVRLLVGHRLPLLDGAEPVRLATADGNGPGVDSVYLAPGTGEYVQATGGGPDSRSTGQLFYVSDTGLRYHIKDYPTAEALGVTGVKIPDGAESAPQWAPWPVLSLLPPGPELSQQAALVAHDGMAADPDSISFAPGD
ncbi:type VII secretion protein EccB [Mycobacterium sp. LTG2003]